MDDRIAYAFRITEKQFKRLRKAVAMTQAVKAYRVHIGSFILEGVMKHVDSTIEALGKGKNKRKD